MTRALNASGLPLVGAHLIEASAGTGKTWTIASLYVRLILGLGSPQGLALRPPQILVVTFTRAATRELVDRIRARLVQAQRAFEGSASGGVVDEFLSDLLAQVPLGVQRQEAAWRLEQAACGMDDASVTTIDAWVQRLLNEHVLAVGEPRAQQLLDRDDAWIQEAARDYWRSQVYALDPAAMAVVADVVDDPAKLAAWLHPALQSHESPPPAPDADLQCTLGPLSRARADALTMLKSDWIDKAQAIEDWFEDRLRQDPKAFKGNLLKGMATVRRWTAAIRAWALSPSAWLEGVNHGKPDKRQLRIRLTPAGLLDLHSKHTRPAAQDALPGWSRDFEDLVASLDRLNTPHEALGLHALGWMARRLSEFKLSRQAWTFDDLLERALKAVEGRAELALQVRQQYPVALVDEFQDTSPRQLRLLRAVYGLGEPEDQSAALLLIGDPKQSIYRFRGADIHGYLEARRRLHGRLHALDSNRRSVTGLVQAVNHLFEQAERRCTEGAQAGAFLHGADVPFEPVHPLGPQERLVGASGPLPVLQVWTEATVRGPAEGRALDAARAAERIVNLLDAEGAGFELADGRLQRVRPRDCCVLVRSRTEAAAVRSALGHRGVASAYLSERDSVLESDEARELLAWLQAWQAPRDLAQARRVWAGRVMGLSLAQQIAQRDDEPLWDARIQRLQDSAARWRRHGVLAAVRHFVQHEGVAERALADTTEGARRLTNVLHIAEWLQSLSEHHREPAALLRAFAAVIHDPARALEQVQGLRDDTLMRLETDQDVVQVVTIHKSKGLQYPIVLLPFAVSAREDHDAAPAITFSMREGRWRLIADETADEAEQDGLESLETLREDVRLLYVAMTRAVHQLWIGACPRKPSEKRSTNWHRTALGHLVSSGTAPEDAQAVVYDLRRVLEPLMNPIRSTALAALEVLQPEFLEPVTMRLTGSVNHDVETAAARQALNVTRPIDRFWRITSYTGIAQGAGDEDADWHALRWDEPAAEPDAPGQQAMAAQHQAAQDDVRQEAHGPPSGSWHLLPSSAALGQFLHELLEAGASHGFSCDADSGWPAELAGALQASAWADHAETISSWLHAVVTQPLAGLDCALVQLKCVRPELEFWMPLERIDLRAVDKLIQAHLWPGMKRPALRPQLLEGLVMGFADLVFEHGGRCHVLDYKSNRLGERPHHYTEAAMIQALMAHRYDIQAALYLLAVHRLLRQRKGMHYDPAIHLGGAHFLFLRGVDRPGGSLLSVPGDLLWLDALDRLLAGTGTKAMVPHHGPVQNG